MVDWLPRASVIKYHKLGGLKQQKSILPPSWGPRHLRSSVSGLKSLRGSRGGSLLPFPASGVSRGPQAHGCLPPSLPCLHVVSLLCLCRSFVSYQDSEIEFRAPPTQDDLLPTTLGKTLFPGMALFTCFGDTAFGATI